MYGKNGFPCGQCRAPMNLPIPYFGKTETLAKDFESMSLEKDQNNSLWTFFNNIANKEYLSEKFYDRKNLQTCDLADLK